jgi:hypothetical protein
MPRRVLVWLALLALAGAGHAQGVVVAAPPDRFVAPGSYATLVFRLSAVAARDVDVSAQVSEGWRVLRQTGGLRLEAGRSTPVAVTVEVPADAPALRSASLTLTVTSPGDRSEGRVALTPLEVVDLTLEAPATHVLGTGGLAVVAVNRGNAPTSATLELLHLGDVVERRVLDLPGGGRESVLLEIDAEGTHTLRLTDERGAEVRRPLTVLRYGVAPPPPLLLGIALTGDVAAPFRPHGTLAVAGPLSDFASLDAAVDVATWRRSYAEVAFDAFSVRIGSGGRDPFGLGLPAPFGVAGAWRRDAWGLAATVGSSGDDRFTGIVAGAWTAPGAASGPAGARTGVAAAVGAAAGAPLAALRATWVADALTASIDLGYGAGGLDVGFTARIRAAAEVMDADLRVRDLGGPVPAWSASVRHQDGQGTLYVDVAGPQGENAPASARAGLALPLTTPFPGSLNLGLQVGTSSSFAQVAHGVTLGGGWRGAHAVGVRLDEGRLGVSLDAGWTRFGEDYVALDARLVYAPALGRLDGRIGARYQVVTDDWTVGASGGWDLGERSLGASASIGWRDGAWRAEFTGSTAYAVDGAPAEAWSGAALLAVGYAFEVEVPARATAAFGGRRLGTLVGRVVGDDGLGVEGVVVEVGPYRLRSDARGDFGADLTPGSYAVAVVGGTVPVAYRLAAAPPATVDVRLRERVELTVGLARTTLLRGRVLEDVDGDGAADEPARGVAARLLLTDAEGLARVLTTDAAGAFEARGLLPGAVALRLLGLPTGAVVVGAPEREVRVGTDAVVEVAFLVRPAAALAQSFAPQALRIRSVAAEAERVPPGAAPLLRVAVQGEVDAVVVETPAGTTPLTLVDGAWLGRLAVPADAPAGVWTYTVVARAGEAEARRRGQLVVDGSVDPVVVAGDPPVRPGGVLALSVTVLGTADEVQARSPFGDLVALREAEPGRWVGAIPVPADAPDAVVALEVDVVGFGDATLVRTFRFRVLAP